MSDHLHSGAGPCPECDPDAWIESSGGGLPPGMAGRIAESIISEPAQGRSSSGGPGEWDHERDSLSPDETARSGNRRRPSGVPYGYGDTKRSG